MNPNLVTDEASGKKVIFINSSALKGGICLRRFALTVGGYCTDGTTIATFYGEAFHVFIAEYYRTKDWRTASEKALEFFVASRPPFVLPDYRDEEHLQKAMSLYALEYAVDNLTPIDHNGLLVEQTFAIEADDLLPDNTNYKLVLFGTFDALCKDQDNRTVLLDHKTTSVYAKDNYLSSYAASSQLLFYTYVLKRYGKKYSLEFLEDFDCQINGIFISSNPLNTKFKRSERFYYKESLLLEFEKTLKMAVARLVGAFDSSEYPPPEGLVFNLCNSAFGVCPYFHYCTTGSIQDVELMPSKVFYGLDDVKP